MNVRHVVPNGDLIEHDADSFGTCVCGPDVRPIIAGMVTETTTVVRHVGWVVIHHSLDGRELQEA